MGFEEALGVSSLSRKRQTGGTPKVKRDQTGGTSKVKRDHQDNNDNV